MSEAKEKVRKLTDEELDQVTGGNWQENKNMWQAIYKNKYLFNSLTGEEQTVILGGLNRNVLTGKQKSLLERILSEKLGINATLNVCFSSKGTKDGAEMTASDIVTAIGNYHAD